MRTYSSLDLTVFPGRAPSRYTIAARCEYGETSHEVALDPAMTTSADRTTRSAGAERFRTLFAGPLRTLYESARQQAKQQRRGLRLRLHSRAIDVNWELLFDPDRDEFVALSWETPVVRRMGFRPAPVSRIARAMRVLGISAPHHDAGIAHEQAAIMRALAQNARGHNHRAQWLPNATWQTIQQTLWNGPWPMIHLASHMHAAGQMVLGMDDADGHDSHTGMGMEAQAIVRLVSDAPGVQLVVLATRDRGSLDIAHALMRRGVPAVIAMRDGISDHAASTFSEVLYRALAHGFVVEHAVTEARKALSMAESSDQWHVPVLLMNSR